MAVLPFDRRVIGNWLLIELLCHRAFATFPNQGTVRRVSSSSHAPAGPGDVLVITAYPATHGSLRWLEATVARGDDLIAIVSALHDGPVVGPTGDTRLRGRDDLAHEFNRLTTCSAPDHV